MSAVARELAPHYTNPERVHIHFLWSRLHWLGEKIADREQKWLPTDMHVDERNALLWVLTVAGVPHPPQDWDPKAGRR